MSNIEYKVGDRVKIVSTDHTKMGHWNGMEVGLIGKVYEVRKDSVGNDLSIMFENDQWGVNSKDVVIVPDDTPITYDHITRTMVDEAIGLGGVSGDLVKPHEEEKKPIKSDGGSSGYYFTKLPHHIIDRIVITGGIEVKDFVRYCLDNDADCKDIVKALKRICEFKKGGGKEGVDAMYDATKIKFFANELYEQIKHEQGDQG